MSRAIALVVAASLLGDTFLYTVLPVSAAKLGVAPLIVGLILSLNRWVRLFTNPVAARLYERAPGGVLVLAAILIASVSTALYLDPSLVLLVFAARLVWGFCWSVLRLGAVLSAVDEVEHRAGRALGTTRGVWGLGYLAGAVYAPFALEAYGWQTAVLGAALLTAIAGIGPALVALPWRRAVMIHDEERPAPASLWEPRMVALYVCGALQLIASAGILVVAGGIRIGELYRDGADLFGIALQATFIAGAFVLAQRVAQVIWQPVAGRLADASLDTTYIVGSALASTGIAMLALPLGASAFVAAAVLANFTQLTASLAAELAVARRTHAVDRPRALATFHTWQDAGAALGALAGGALAAVGTSFALLVGAAALAITLPLWWYARAESRVAVRA